MNAVQAAEIAESPLQDLDRLVESFYTTAFESPWQAFRPQALERLCEWSRALAGVWLTRTATDLPGEFAVWPAEAAIPREVVAAVSFSGRARERELRPVPCEWGWGAAQAGQWVLALSMAHRGTPMHSILCLVFPGEIAPDRAQMRRAVGHLTQAGTLALSQFIQRDEWLQALGRPSRGSATLVDAKGGVYVASRRFRRLIADQFGDAEFSCLPFALPPAVMEAGHGHFDMGALHFRMSRENGLFLLHARRPHPLDVLSPREQEIARALAEGKTFKSVARECDIAISTVANHASRIYKKLGIYRREELVALLRNATVSQVSAA